MSVVSLCFDTRGLWLLQHVFMGYTYFPTELTKV